MDISQRARAILSFVEAANGGSFAAAARALSISPAAVSKNIAGLEQTLGVRLMNRTTRKLSLTEEGDAFLKQARLALEALDMAVDAITAQKKETSGHVRISTSAVFGRDYVLPALPGLFARHPALTVEADFDDRVIDLVRDGYDIALRGGLIAVSSLVSRTICQLHLVLVASPAYLSAYGTPKTPDDLKKHRLIARRFLGGRLSPWGFRASDGSLTTFEPENPLLTLSAPETLTEAACQGLGIAQVGVHNALKHLKSGALKAVLTEEHDPGDYTLAIQYPHRALIAPRVRATVDYLLETFRADERLHFPAARLKMFR